MKVYAGLDTGTETSHLATYREGAWGANAKATVLFSGPNEEMLHVLRAHGQGIARCGDMVAIESMDARGMRLGQETLDTLVWIGRFQEASGGVLVPRSVVKDRLCGSRKADDAAIRLVLIDRLGKPGTKKNQGPTYGISGHLWQALAVAVTYADMVGRKGEL